MANSSDRFDKQLESEVDDLLRKGQEYYPFSAEMICNAAGEMDSNMYERFRVISALLEDGQNDVAGALLSAVIQDFAKACAVREINRKHYL